MGTCKLRQFITSILFCRSKKDLDKKRAEADEMAVKAVINTVNLC